MTTWKCNRCGAQTRIKPSNMQHSCGGGWKKQEEDSSQTDSSPSLFETIVPMISDMSIDADPSPASDPSSPDFSGGGGDFSGGGASGEW